MIPNVLHPLKSAIRFSSSASVALTLVRDLWHGRRLEIVNLDKSGYSLAGIGHTTSREHECHAVRWPVSLLPWGEYLFSVAAGVPPAVEPGILPGGFSCGLRRQLLVQSCHSGRQDAALYGSQDGCRYSRKPTLNTYLHEGAGQGEGETLDGTR